MAVGKERLAGNAAKAGRSCDHATSALSLATDPISKSIDKFNDCLRELLSKLSKTGMFLPEPYGWVHGVLKTTPGGTVIRVVAFHRQVS